VEDIEQCLIHAYFFNKIYAFGIVRMSITGFVATIQYRVSKIGADEKPMTVDKQNTK
jgi:hypothetical protein